jgi:hypothetical protein
MQGKLSNADWERIEEALVKYIGPYDAQSPVPQYEATLDRIQFHNKTGPYAVKLVH